MVPKFARPPYVQPLVIDDTVKHCTGSTLATILHELGPSTPHITLHIHEIKHKIRWSSFNLRGIRDLQIISIKCASVDVDAIVSAMPSLRSLLVDQCSRKLTINVTGGIHRLVLASPLRYPLVVRPPLVDLTVESIKDFEDPSFILNRLCIRKCIQDFIPSLIVSKLKTLVIGKDVLSATFLRQVINVGRLFIGKMDDRLPSPGECSSFWSLRHFLNVDSEWTLIIRDVLYTDKKIYVHPKTNVLDLDVCSRPSDHVTFKLHTLKSLTALSISCCHVTPTVPLPGPIPLRHLRLIFDPTRDYPDISKLLVPSIESLTLRSPIDIPSLVYSHLYMGLPALLELCLNIPISSRAIARKCKFLPPSLVTLHLHINIETGSSKAFVQLDGQSLRHLFLTISSLQSLTSAEHLTIYISTEFSPMLKNITIVSRRPISIQHISNLPNALPISLQFACPIYYQHWHPKMPLTYTIKYKTSPCCISMDEFASLIQS